MIVADAEHTLTLSGAGDVLEPDDGVTSVGSGSASALAAARALIRFAPDLSAEEIARESMRIAAEIDIYTNDQIVVETL
jgi:ATP-dependent HslUV protease subunit HslV